MSMLLEASLQMMSSSRLLPILSGCTRYWLPSSMETRRQSLAHSVTTWMPLVLAGFYFCRAGSVQSFKKMANWMYLSSKLAWSCIRQYTYFNVSAKRASSCMKCSDHNSVLIGLHRPLSKLDYNSLESKSRCAPSETPELITFMDDRIPNFHSAKIIHALGEQFRILSLSNGFVQHSPFITCMLANSTIAQMSACLYFLKGEQLTLARERLRATMGILGEFARVWSLGGRTLRELKYIAQEAFRLPTVARSLTAHLTIESNPQDELQESWGLDTSWFEESDLAMAATLDGIEGPVQQSFITI